VIAARSGDHARRWDFTKQKICECAARLKGTGVLKQFQLESELKRIDAHISAVDLYDRRASHVRPNELLTSTDLVFIKCDGNV
jgi:hypothetical protein